MAKIIPFRGLRPRKEFASQVATLPYDVCSVAEARAYRDQPHHFYHVTRSEIDLPEDMDVHSPEVYKKAAANLSAMVAEGVLIQDEQPCYYIYRLVMDGRAQTGLVCGSSIADYNEGVIKKHEFTRPEKEQDRIDHIMATRAQTGVVFLAYNNLAEMDALVNTWVQAHAPEYHFTAEDGVEHAVWVVYEKDTVSRITELFAAVPATYIADGHHRAASAARVAEIMGSREPGGEDAPYNYFLTCIFPASQLQIMDYNRVVSDLNGMSPAAFLEALGDVFTVAPQDSAYRPRKAHEFGLYLEGRWYSLEAREGTYGDDPISALDVSILQQNVLSRLLGINDPRTDKRIAFVGGIRGLQELERLVGSGEMAAAFACYPVSIAQLFEVADSGKVMPPKSTWFEPKTRDGLVVYTF